TLRVLRTCRGTDRPRARFPAVMSQARKHRGADHLLHSLHRLPRRRRLPAQDTRRGADARALEGAQRSLHRIKTVPKTILQPRGWAAPRGYANGIAARGTVVSIAGQIGWNDRCEFETDDFVGQARQALANVRAVLAEAGGGPEHIVRMTW